MFIVMTASECAPVAKAGGLADVVYGLSRELEIRGHAVEIILPKYDCMRYDHIWGLHISYPNLWVPWGKGAIQCDVWFGFVHGRKCFFIDPHSPDSFFNRHHFYGSADDPIRFSFFSKAAIEFIFRSGKRPDIIHTHDWQTALVPVLLYEIYQFSGMENTRICHTVHNFKHQGTVGRDVLALTGLNRPEHFYHPDRLLDNNNSNILNLSKGAIVYANFVTTVSPHHAWEVLHTDVGFGLQSTLWHHQVKFGGVLNGLDYDMWNPALDPLIPETYDSSNPTPKYTNKEMLRHRLLLADSFKPIIAFVGRLDPQKGVHLIEQAILEIIHQGGQFILLGSGTDPGLTHYFWELKHRFNDHPDIHLEIGYNEELAHLIYAGADMLLIPSLYEPCGLTQLIALRYGTVPLAHAVGGLQDTIFDYDYANKPMEERNGYLFEIADQQGVASALFRGIRLWYEDPLGFRQLLQCGMRCDYSWNRPGEDYLNIYHYIRH